MNALAGPAVRLARLRARKLASLAIDPGYWPFLRAGVAASVEHLGIPFPDHVRTVLDVGASRGQFAAFALRRWPGATLHCFEPLAEPRMTLERVRQAHGAARMHVHGVALGAERATAAMHVTRHDDSSSLLPPTVRQTHEFPGSNEVSLAQTSVDRLDRVLSPDLLTSRVLLKIDVQGTEQAVLAGAVGLLPFVDAVFVECSFVELYRGQALASDIVLQLRGGGFQLRGVFSPSRDASGACLQADFLFARGSPLPA